MYRVEYTVVEICGDYAILRTQDGRENQVAMALLPEGLQEGARVLFENFEYRMR